MAAALRVDPVRLIWPLALATAVAVGLVAGYQAQAALALALALGFMLLALADLRIGLAGFVVISFMGLLPSVGAPALSLPKLAGLVLLISWLAVVATQVEARSGVPAVPAALLVPGALFLGWALLSVTWAESAGEASSSVYRYALNLILVPIVFAVLRTRRDATWIAAAFVGGATIAAIYGLLVPPDASSIGSGLSGSAELTRVGGTIGDPNELAAVMVAGIALAAGLSGRAVSGAARLLLLSAGVLCLAALLLSVSRGGLIALGTALLAGVLLGGRWRPTFAVLAVAAAGISVFYFTAVSERAAERLTRLEGGTGRTDIWKVGWRMFEDKPVTGAGAGNFPQASIHYVVEPGPLRRSDLIVSERQVTHNVYLSMLSELGAVGLALFGAIVCASIVLAIRAARAFARLRDPAMELLARSSAIALLGLLAAAFFLSYEYSKQLWLLIAFGPALLVLARREEAEEEEAA